MISVFSNTSLSGLLQYWCPAEFDTNALQWSQSIELSEEGCSIQPHKLLFLYAIWISQKWCVDSCQNPPHLKHWAWICKTKYVSKKPWEKIKSLTLMLCNQKLWRKFSDYEFHERLSWEVEGFADTPSWAQQNYRKSCWTSKYNWTQSFKCKTIIKAKCSPESGALKFRNFTFLNLNCQVLIWSGIRA